MRNIFEAVYDFLYDYADWLMFAWACVVWFTGDGYVAVTVTVVLGYLIRIEKRLADWEERAEVQLGDDIG